MLPWVNHDIHRTKVAEKVTETKPKRVRKPYPTQARLKELFYLDGNTLKRIKTYHKKNHNRAAGGMVRGFHYIRVDYMQCKADRLIRIFKGEE
jgi:hypothetical protein